jgi:hypothetical protein
MPISSADVPNTKSGSVIVEAGVNVQESVWNGPSMKSSFAGSSTSFAA